MNKRYSFGIISVLIFIIILYMLLPDVVATKLWCVIRNEPSPVVYMYPTNGARDVPLDSIVFAKYAYPIPSGPREGPIIIRYADGTIPKPNIFNGFTAEYFYAGPLFNDSSPPTDMEYDTVHKKLENINQNIELVSSFRGGSTWEPNRHVVVEFHRFCYRLLKLEFYTASQ